jgi:phosphate transport system permease protein
MHLGFHIYDVGFQSPDSLAARPIVWCTALLLILVVVMLNLAAIRVRSNLRKKFLGEAF